MKWIILLLLVSCADAPKDWSANGRPWNMRINPEQYKVADNDWKEGFNDGCVSAMEALSSGFNRINAPRVDGWKFTGRNPRNPEEPHPLIKSGKVYGKGWFDGYEHCTYQYDWWVL